MKQLTFLAILSIWLPFSFQTEVLEQVHILFRHGMRYSGVIDPTLGTFWFDQEPLGQPITPGCMTRTGVEEMTNLGVYLRERYVDGGDFVNPAYDQFEVEARADQNGCMRRILSVAAVLEGMFPDAPIPIISELAEDDTFFVNDEKCPSWLLDDERLDGEQNLLVSTEYSDLTASAANLTVLGEVGMPLQPANFIFSVLDMMLMAQSHGYTGYDQWLGENDAEIDEMFLELLTPYGAYFPPESEQLGARFAWEWADHILNKIQMAVDGEEVPKLNIYGSHLLNTPAAATLLGAPWLYLDTASTYIFELWHNTETQERRIQSHFLKRLNNSVIDQFVITELDTCDTVACDGQSEPHDDSERSVEVTAWLANMYERIGEDDGCCDIRPQFFEQGCDNYFSDDTNTNPTCLLYRQFCAEVACGEDGVVDPDTFSCLRIDDEESKRPRNRNRSRKYSRRGNNRSHGRSRWDL